MTVVGEDSQKSTAQLVNGLEQVIATFLKPLDVPTPFIERYGMYV